MNPEQLITGWVKEAVFKLYGADAQDKLIQTQATRKEFEGDITAVAFPLAKISGKSPEITAGEIGSYLKDEYPQVESFNVVKGFLNIKLSGAYWLEAFKIISSSQDWGQLPA